MSHTVVIVDDHDVVRQGLRRALERTASDCEVVGEAGTVAEARALVADTGPDVAILDVVLPDGDGIQLCRELHAVHPDTVCLLLTSFPDPHGLLSAALAGAGAYLGKDSSAADLAETVRTLAGGGTLLPPELLPDLLERLTDTVEEDPRLATLTAQERRVFELIGQGLSNRQIADHLFLAERTIKNYTTRLLDKLQMERRTEAAALAARLAERRAQAHARQPPGASHLP